MSYSENKFGYYLVRTKNLEDTIGICGFLKKPTLGNPDFGFAFLLEHSGQGYALESCSAVFSYWIRQFNFLSVDAVTTTGNYRSIRLLEKLKFQQVGTIDETKRNETIRFSYIVGIQPKNAPWIQLISANQIQRCLCDWNR